MTAVAAHRPTAAELQIATFYVGDLLLGIDIQQVQEINRQLDVTAVPQAPSYVRGVVNLRGEVVTVVDLRTILGLPPKTIDGESRNVVLQTGEEAIGLLVDRIADVMTTRSDDIDEPPANVGGVDGRFFQGVVALETELLVLLDIAETLSEQPSSPH